MARKILIVISLLSMLCSCRQTKLLTERTDNRQTSTERTNSIITDTVFISRQDTILIREKNDTVYIEKIKYEYGYKINNKTDTVVKTDTIYKTEFKEKITEDKTKQIKLRIERIILISIIIILIVVMIWQRWKRYIRN